MFKCPKCGRTFKNSLGLKEHYTRVHKDRLHQCPACQRAFNNEQALIVHLAVKAKYDDEHVIYYYLEHDSSHGKKCVREFRKRVLQLLKAEERSA